MNLADTLYMMMQENTRAGQPTDLKVGTVVSVSPLEISINPQMAPLQASVLYLTAAVVEKKIAALSHTHTADGLGHTHTVGAETSSEALSGEYETGAALGLIKCTENGTALPAGLINRGLQTGDKVLLLRVLSGQKFVVLSRIYE